MADELTRLMRRRQFTILALSGLLAALPAGHANAATAEDYVSRIADEVMALANSGQKGDGLRSRFASLLNRYINLRAIANFALGSYQQKLPGGKKDEFYRLVSNYAAALFVYYVEDFRGTGLEIVSNKQQGKYTVIQSAIMLRGGGREQVKWRLSGSSGGFRIHDVNLKGVWLTISMKDRFSKVLSRSKGDFDALFAELREAETW